MYDTLSKAEIIKHMTKPIPVYYFDSIDSTNSFAKTLTEDFALVVANCQNLGRGRLGRSFHSPQGGIYFSLVASVSDLYQNVPFITTAASVAVIKAIKALYNVETSIKWVNDVYLEGKKIAGILCEVADASRVVIGIGINFYKTALPKEIEHTATYLFETEAPHNRNRFVSLITDNLLSILSNPEDKSFMEYYKAHSLVIGKAVICTRGNESFEAKAVDIDSDGALVVETPQGIQRLNSGEISIKLNC